MTILVNLCSVCGFSNITFHAKKQSSTKPGSNKGYTIFCLQLQNKTGGWRHSLSKFSSGGGFGSFFASKGFCIFYPKPHVFISVSYAVSRLPVYALKFTRIFRCALIFYLLFEETGSNYSSSLFIYIIVNILLFFIQRHSNIAE